EVVLDHLRQSGQPTDLRDHLRQWLEHAPGDDRAGRIARLLEIARISRDSLGDLETAPATWAELLDLDPQNPDALAGLRSLSGRSREPAVELGRVRIELGRAEGERRPELLLAAADTQRTRLDDPAGAIASLRVLQQATGAAGPAYAPLADLLRAQQ